MTGVQGMSIDASRLRELTRAELERFRARHPASGALDDEAGSSLLARVPMQWMVQWAGSHAVYVDHAEEGRLTDVDGNEYVDFCLGDTGAMTGHAPRPVTEAVTAQLARGSTFMLPTRDAIGVAQRLSARFGLGYWQFALSATDANRAAIRYARAITGRGKILVFNHCYHGSVDETFATLDGGKVVAPATSLGPPVDPALTTKVVEFNDTDAVAAALSEGDVAAVLTEPALTNVGIVLPRTGFHAALRELTRASGTLLIIDETHTLSAGPGGYTAAHGLEPDIVVVGKAIAGGLPAAAYGFSVALAARAVAATTADTTDSPGVGGTLAGYAVSLAAMQAALDHVLTPEAFEYTAGLARRWASGVADAISAHGLPWHVTRLGCRAEYHFAPQEFVTGAQAHAAIDPVLERFLHLFMLNRGVLMTPFHNMALMCPGHTDADVDRHSELFGEALTTLVKDRR